MGKAFFKTFFYWPESAFYQRCVKLTFLKCSTSSGSNRLQGNRCPVHGDEKNYSTANMCIKIEGQTYLLNIGVVDNLPYSAVLGQELPVLFDLFEEKQSQTCNVVVTRGQTKSSNEHSETLIPLFHQTGSGSRTVLLLFWC